MAAHNSAELLVVLDFDRTVFDTHRYYQDFLAMVASHYGESQAHNLRAAEAANKYFDPFAYLQEQGIDPAESAAAFRQFHHEKYADKPTGSYVYDDASELIAALNGRPHTKVVILTTGGLLSQRFKLELCPELSQLPHQIIPGNKGIHLQQDIDAHQAVTLNGVAYTRIALVDDRDDVLAHIRPHQGHQLFHIVRPGSKYQPTISRPDIIEISSLIEILSLLQ
jgi:hypothetical protein